MKPTIAVWALSLIVVAPSVANAGDVKKLRLVTVFSETRDNAKQPASIVEAAFTEAWMAKGLRFVDENQARSIRAQVNPEDLVQGKLPAGITSLDADVIIAGTVQLQKREQPFGQFKVYDCTVTARMIAVDTGQTIATVGGLEATANHFSAMKASAKTAKKAGAALDASLFEKLTAHMGRSAITELWVSGLPPQSRAELLAKLKSLPGIEDVTIREMGTRVSKLELSGSGADATKLALTMDSTDAIGLRVVRFSRSRVEAAFNAAGTLSLKVIVGEFTGKKDTWKGKAVAGIIGTELVNADYLEFPLGVDPVQIDGRRLASLLSKNGLDPNTTLVVGGTHQTKNDQITVRVQITHAKTGTLISAQQGTCTERELSKCAAKLGETLSAGLLDAVLKKRVVKPADARRVQMAMAGASRQPLEIMGAVVEDIFPARLSSYAKYETGSLLVKNTGDKPLTKVTVSVEIPGFTKAPVVSSIASLAPGAVGELPIKVLLDQSRLRRHDTKTQEVMQLSLTYNEEEYSLSAKYSRPLLVFGRHAVDWKDALSVAAFVTPQSKGLREASGAALSAVPDQKKKDPLAAAAALYAAMADLKYRKDPSVPYATRKLDLVQYPTETLSKKSGDCDDLAVLFAGLAHSAGESAALVLTRSHVLAAIEMPYPTYNLGPFTAMRDRFLMHKGRLWLPIETTLVSTAGFVEAWDRAAKQIAALPEESYEVVVIDEAWREYAPSDLSETEDSNPAVAMDRLVAAIGVALVAAEKERQTAFDSQLAAIDKRLLKGDMSAGQEKARLLALTGQVDRARTVLSNLSTESAEGLNNLANVDMLSGTAKVALAKYKRARKLAPDNRFVLLNAALASLAAGDNEGLAAYLEECKRLGAVADLTRLALAYAGSVRVSGAGDAETGAGDRLLRAMKVAGMELPETPVGSSADRASPRIAAYLRWL